MALHLSHSSRSREKAGLRADR
jgi:hypothetical protein